MCCMRTALLPCGLALSKSSELRYSMQRWTCVYFISFVAVKWLLGSVYGGCVPQGNATDCGSSACDCIRGTMTCSHNNLSTVPRRLMTTVTVLYLDENNIENLNEFDFEGCTHVRTIDLSQNSIVSISNFTFKDTGRLRHLLLQYNLISYSTLCENTFVGLADIYTLDISNNAWKNSTKYGHDAFKSMKNLTKLHIDILPGVIFPKEISNSKCLRRLVFHSDNLRTITNETFADFVNSSVLNVSIHSSYSLRKVEPLSFAHFKNLRVLDISDNYHLGLENASKAFYGLQYTRITKLVLTNITPDMCSGKIANGFFRYLNLTNITELVMSKNRITKIDNKTFSYKLPRLKRLDLSYNQIRDVQSLVGGLSGFDQLHDIDLSYQLTPTPRYRYGGGLRELRADYSMASDEFESFVADRHRKCPNDELVYQKCTEGSSLIFGGKSFSRRRLRSSPICLKLPPRLKMLRLREAIRVEAFNLPQVTISNGKDLEFIDLSSNGLRQVRGPVIFIEPVTDLKVDLSDNQIECISSQAFFYSRLNGSRLSEIDLSKNRLGDFLQNDRDGETFQYLQELKKLNLSKNGIKYLPPNVFAYNRNLAVLDLSSNALKEIGFYFSHMENLLMINISDNLITTLTDSVMRNMTLMFGRNDTGSRDVEINLNINPVQCSCDNVKFLHWIAANRHRMADIEFYACERIKPYVNLSNIESLVESLDYRCRKWIAVIVSGMFTGMALLLLAAMVVCYRNRWEVRFACLKLTQRSRRYQQLTAQQILYRYDAFVVYDASDRKWVIDELMPHLERQYMHGIQSSPCPYVLENSEEDPTCMQTFKLCVHERDFPPGEEIITNIWQKMELSRKVILVISKNFTMSRFCEYEMNLARMHSVELGRNVIVPIILEMPELDSVSDSLHWILRKVTYIEWPTQERDRGEFWDNLKHVLSDDKCI